MISKVWEKIIWILWVLSVAALPLTSFPFVARLTGSNSVAPGTLVFLIPLAVLWLPVYFLRRKALPFQVKPVLLFFIFALFTIGLAFFRIIPDYKDQKVISAAIEGAATLALGVLFYLVFVSMLNTNKKIEATLRLLNWTGSVVIFWSTLQWIVKPGSGFLFTFIDRIQSALSITQIFEGRMTGFAAEPSWLAHMLNLVYLAYWLAASLNRTSVHHFRVWKFTFENFLLVGGILVLFGTLSRGGLAAFFSVLALVFILLNIRFIGWLARKWNEKSKTWLTIIISLGVILAYFCVVFGGLFVLSKVDPRMENVFQFSNTDENQLVKYAEELQFGERVVYWQTGWNIFNDYPVLGVGVGFSGFYFPRYLPDSGWGLSETRKLLYHSPNLMNVKNMWSRLLAETGIIGFSLFILFLFIFAVTAVELIKSRSEKRQTMGYMGVFMLTALVLEEFSVDSFALPYLWFTLGLVTAAWRWYFPIKGEING